MGKGTVVLGNDARPLGSMQKLQPHEWNQVFDLLDAALDLPEETRAAWVESLDDALRPILSELLTRHAGLANDEFLHGLPQFTRSDSVRSGPDIGAVVGPYRLQREIGRGGMGTVWLAERIDGSFKRSVALKLPHFMWLGDLAERMHRERDILASLEHPNIARLYDAGLDEHGRPFMAMEYVAGVPIDSYCTQRRGDLHARVMLLLQVARATAHAHAKLIVHRDLKPGNVFVDDAGSVRLLDFGVAKLLGRDGNDPHTQFALRPMTRDYAAPELVLGQEVSAATDVYSIGVIAFELLAGVNPRRVDDLSLASIQRIDGDFPRASDVATDPALRRQLRGDLDAILAKALKPLASERYATAEALAADLQRFLDGQPVSAQADTRSYRAFKFVRRYRVAIAATCCVALALVCATIVSVRQARIAASERNRAVELLARNEAVAGFAEQILTEVASPDRPITIDALLERAEQLVFAGTARNTDHQAAILLALGRYYAAFDNRDKATALLSQASQLASTHSDTGLRAKIDCERSLVELAADIELARQRVQDILAIRELPADASAVCWRIAARLAAITGDSDGTLQAVGAARTALARADLPDQVLAATLLADEGIAHQLAGRYARADESFAAALDAFERAGRPEHPVVIAVWNDWAGVLDAAGDVPDALAKYEHAVAIATKHAVGGHPPTSLLFNYARMLAQIGRHEEALAIYDRELVRAEQIASPRSLAAGLLGKARAYFAKGDFQSAQAIVDQLLRRSGTMIPSNSRDDLALRSLEGRIALARGDVPRALKQLSLALDDYDARGMQVGAVVTVLCARSEAHLRSGNIQAAIDDAQRALAVARVLQANKPASVHTAYSLLALSKVEAVQRNSPASRLNATEAARQFAATLGEHHSETRAATRLSLGAPNSAY